MAHNMKKSERVKWNLKLMGGRAEIKDFMKFMNNRDKYGINQWELRYIIKSGEIMREGEYIFLSGGGSNG